MKYSVIATLEIDGSYEITNETYNTLADCVDALKVLMSIYKVINVVITRLEN